jgi:hypothetical protein
MRKLGDEAGGFLASKVLPVALLFVSVAAGVRVIQEAGQEPVGRLIGAFLGPWATLAVLLGMCTVGAVWFLKGDITNPFRKILALALVGLPVALLFGVLQPPQLRAHWGGIAGSNLGRVVAALPDTLSAGVAVLLLVTCMWLAWKLAFGSPVAGPSQALAFAGIAAASAARQSNSAEPLFASAVAEAEPMLELTKRRALADTPRQSTLFDSLGTAEEAIAAAEVIANAPVAEAEAETSAALHVPPWLSERSGPVEAANAPEAEASLADSPAACTLDAAAAAPSAATIAESPESVEAILAKDTDLEPLVGELELPTLEDEADIPAPMAVSSGILEELEGEELAAEDAAADYTVDDDISAELDESVLGGISLPRLATSAPALMDDEFSVAAQILDSDRAAPTIAAVAEDIERPLAPNDVTGPVPLASSCDPATSSADAFRMAADESAAPHVQQAMRVASPEVSVAESASFMHPALLALSPAPASDAAETECVESHSAESAALAAVEHTGVDAHLAAGDFELTFDEAEDESLLPKPMLVSPPDWQGELDDLDEPEDLALASDLQCEDEIRCRSSEEEFISQNVEVPAEPAAPLFEAVDTMAASSQAAVEESGAVLFETVIDSEATLAASAPTESHAEAELPASEPQVTFVPPMPAEDVEARPQFTLLRGGPEATPSAPPLPHHLAVASLEAPSAEVTSEAPAPRKRKGRSKDNSGWADWEAAPKRAKRAQGSADDAGQAFLFAGGNELDPELLRRAEELVVAEARCSELMLQRKLELSWAEASRIIERLEVMGVVSAADPSGRRNILRRASSADADHGF